MRESKQKQKRIKTASEFWKRLGYIGLFVSIVAGIVKIVEYFQKPIPTNSTEQNTIKPDSIVMPLGVSTTGDQSPATYAPNGNVTVTYDNSGAKPKKERSKSN